MLFFGELKSLQVRETSLSAQPGFGKFPWISVWILVSLTTQIYVWIPLHWQPQAIPGDSPQNPRDFAPWVQAYCFILLKTNLQQVYG